MTDAIVVLCTAPPAKAEPLARGLVEQRLAACVNMLQGVRSFYRWDGAIQDDAEVQLIIKTTRARFAALQAWLDDNHPYDVPEILALDVAQGAGPYLSWLTAEVAAEAEA